MIAPKEGGVSSLPESVQYLPRSYAPPRSYAQSTQISSGIIELRSVGQSHSES